MRRMTARGSTRMCYAACAWCVLFGAPHLWWALGYPAGFPGGDVAFHRFMSSSWRYAYDVAVVALSAVGATVALRLRVRTPPARRYEFTTAAMAAGALTVRGVAGMIADGRSDPVWWPMFLTGGLLFGGVVMAQRHGTVIESDVDR